MQEHTDLREDLNKWLTPDSLRSVATRMQQRIRECGRIVPQPKISDRVLARMQMAQNKRQRIEEQLREDGIDPTPQVSSQVWARSLLSIVAAMQRCILSDVSDAPHNIASCRLMLCALPGRGSGPGQRQPTVIWSAFIT